MENFEGNPVPCECPFCKESIVTFVKMKSSWLSYVSAILAIGLTGPLACVLGPLLWHWAKDTAHSCPRCLNRIATVSAVSLPKLWTSDILTFRFGGCACIVTWKYLLTGICIFSFFILLRLGSRPTIGPASAASESDFLEICSQKARVENPMLCEMGFSGEFSGRSIKWRAKIENIEWGGIWVSLGGEKIFLFLPGNLHAEAAKLSPGQNVTFHATFLPDFPPPSLFLHQIYPS